MNSDLKDLITLFNAFGIRYMVAGGYAVSFYGDPRFTKDLDVAVASKPDDIEKLSQALEEFGYPISQEACKEFAEPNRMIIFGNPPNRIDILNELKGIGFEEAYERRKLVKIGELDVQMISLEDLLLNKQATGRPLDLIDIKMLESRRDSGHIND